MIKRLATHIEDFGWDITCRYNYWLHGPYGLAKIIEKMPFRVNTRYLRKYGATIGEKCVIERGINLHRPLADPPFKNLQIGDNVYLGHKILIDLSDEVLLKSGVKIGAGSQIWTHTGYFLKDSLDSTVYREDKGKTTLGRNVIIYSNVIIRHGISIGDNVHVGAGSVVIRDLPPQCFAAGNPAVIKDRTQGRI